jgi:hypothetical protein
MHDVLKQLNDRNPSDLQTLDERALQRLESLCENWAKKAEAELARRRSLPLASANSGSCR